MDNVIGVAMIASNFLFAPAMSIASASWTAWQVARGLGARRSWPGIAAAVGTVIGVFGLLPSFAILEALSGESRRHFGNNMLISISSLVFVPVVAAAVSALLAAIVTLVWFGPSYSTRMASRRRY